jgi:hypothetical protein
MPYVGPENVPGRGINALDTATNVGGESAGLQAVLAQLRARGVTKIDANAIRSLVNENARDPGSADVNPQTLGPTVLNLRNAGIEDASPMPARGGGGGGGGGGSNDTSAQPTPSRSITPTAASDSATPTPMPPAVDPASGSSLLQSLAPLLAGGGAAAFPLGRYILDKMRGGDVPGVAGIPGSVPMLPSPEARPLLTGPEGAPAVAGPRVGAPQLAAPGEAPPIALPNQSTGRPPIPLQDANVPRPALETAGVQLSPANPATAPVPETPASAAIDKAVPADAPVAPRARAPRAKAPRLRVPAIR